MSTTRIRSKLVGDRYLSLVRAFPLRPIRTARAHREAMRVLHSLWNERGTDVDDYVFVLVSLIEAYERDAGFAIDTSKITAAEIVRFLLDENSMSVNALAKELGIAQSALSDMLNGNRAWSKAAIVAITDRFKLKPDLFLREASPKIRS